jgi:hypothetical protein
MKKAVDIARAILSEATEADMHREARDHYQGIAPDLYQAVPHGQGHHDAAHDHIADHLHDKYHATHPKANFRAITKKALHRYVDDDRAETRANEAKEKRREAARHKPPRVKKSKIPEPYWKKAGYNTPMGKPRKGIGSA